MGLIYLWRVDTLRYAHETLTSTHHIVAFSLEDALREAAKNGPVVKIAREQQVKVVLNEKETIG